MIVNGKQLLAASPIVGMLTGKEKAGGVTYGLAEVGYDVRIKQGLHFTRDELGNKITVVNDGDSHPQLLLGWALNVNIIEEFTMPKDLVGIGHPKSSWNRQHLRLGTPIIEPGWNGFLTISLNYVGEGNLLIEPGAGIMQVIFHQLETEAAYQGRYQRQPDAIVGAIAAQ